MLYNLCIVKEKHFLIIMDIIVQIMNNYVYIIDGF